MKTRDLEIHRLYSQTDRSDLITAMTSHKRRSCRHRQKALDLPADIEALLVKDDESQADPEPDVGGDAEAMQTD